MSGGNDGVGFAVPVEDFSVVLDQVEAAGGADAPTVPAPESDDNLFGNIPGLDDLPGLDALPGLDELVPALDKLMDDLFEAGDIPDELRQLLDELFGDTFAPSDEDES